jgi:hypothetical protein
MAWSHWFRSLAAGLSGLNLTAESTTWRRRRIHGPISTEPLETRVLLAANALSSRDTVVALEPPPVGAIYVKSPGENSVVSDGEQPQSSTAVGDAGALDTPDSDSGCSYQLCGTDVGGADLSGQEVGGAGGEIEGGGAVGGDVDGGVAGGDPAGDGGAIEGGGAVGGGEVGGDVSGDVGGEVGGVGGGVGGAGGGVGGAGGSGEVTIVTTDDEAWEGPYSFSWYDRGAFKLLRTDYLAEATVQLRLSGTASTADYWISTPYEEFPPFGLGGVVNLRMPAGIFAMPVYTTALMDGDYEPDESVIATVVGVLGGGSVGNQNMAMLTIVDHQADLDITDLGSAEAMNEDDEDDPGANIRLNRDNDAGMLSADADWYTSRMSDGGLDARILAEEDDFAVLSVTDMFQWPNDVQTPDQLQLYLEYNAAQLRIWRFSEGAGGATRATVLLPGEEVSSSETLRIEGINYGVGAIELHWRSRTDPALTHVADKVSYTVWRTDLDIDSDNNDGFDFPENSDWEEHLEDHSHALGKLIKTEYTHFTPVRLRLNPGLDPHDPAVRVRLEFKIEGQSGRVKLWNTFKADPGRDASARDVRDGGSRFYPSEYSLREIGYDPASGAATLWIEATSVSPNHWDKYGVETNGKPDDRITTELHKNDLHLTTDQVKYMLIEPDSFYDHLQHREELRTGIASTGVYELADMPEFALRPLTHREIEGLGLSAEIAAEFNGTSIAGESMEAAVYRDYVSGKFVVAFAGTDFGEVQDVLNDIWQGTGTTAPYYESAMAIGAAISAIPELQGNVVVTGHSLGGGLASAASVVGLLPADTFNAAGLATATLLDGDGEEKYAGSLHNLRHAAPTLIDAYFLDWDLLSLVQDVTPLPDAVGKRWEMEGPVDSELSGTPLVGIVSIIVTAFTGGQGWPTVAATLGYAGVVMGMAHTSAYYQYGLMVREGAFGGIEWDIYGYTFYQ